jgi:hypothetical protein
MYQAERGKKRVAVGPAIRESKVCQGAAGETSTSKAAGGSESSGDAIAVPAHRTDSAQRGVAALQGRELQCLQRRKLASTGSVNQPG